MTLRTSPPSRHRPQTFAAALAIGTALSPAPVLSNPGGYSLLGNGAFFQNASTPAPRSITETLNTVPSNTVPFNTVPSAAPDMDQIGQGAVSLNPAAASLFRGRSSGSLFEQLASVSFDVAKIMDLIATAEAGKANYDAVQYGATIKPPKAPTAMTLGEVYAWIKATPGQPHAIGRYQFIPATLRRLADNQAVPLSRRFSPGLQDQLAHQLIEEAGLSEFKGGTMTQVTFMNNLAKIWAGLPTSSGKSYYHNYVGNRATVTWDTFKSQMDIIFSS